VKKSLLNLKSIRIKIIGSFLLIIGINAVSGFVSLKNIKELSSLVNITYDQSLMAATFSQSAKFNFSQLDSSVKSALMATRKKSFAIDRILADDAFETLIEDLEVVEERNLDKSQNVEIEAVKKKLREIEKQKNEVLDKKSLLLNETQDSKKKNEASMALFKAWDELKLKKRLLRSISGVHDSAAERGYAFRVESDKKNKDTIKRSLGILVFCLLFSLIVSFAVAFLIIKPLFKLQRVCFAIQEGDFNQRSSMKRADEFGELSIAFDFMLDTIQEKTENIRSLIASLPFGLFYVSREGSISLEKSPATSKIFDKFDEVKTLGDFYKDHGCSPSQIDQVLNAAFSKTLPFKAALNLLPSDLQLQVQGSDNKYVRLSFEPSFTAKEKLERVIIIAEDMTENRKSETERERLFERVDRISRISTNVDSFESFKTRVLELFTSCTDSLKLKSFTEEDLDELNRGLHTLKGLLGLYSFNGVSSFVHECESLTGAAAYSDASEQLISGKELFCTQVDDVNELLDLKGREGTVTLMRQKVLDLKRLSSDMSSGALKSSIRDLDCYPFSYLAKKYERYVKKVLIDFPEKAISVKIEAGQELDQGQFNKVDASFMHLVNNSIGHGIEDRSQRSLLGKPDVGQITIKIEEKTESKITFLFRDDGNGIDGEAVFQSAVKKQLVSEDSKDQLSQQQMKELIFIAGFSTQDEASSISGRGVGMDVVKNDIESVGGSISLSSEVGKFTEFRIHIPLTEVSL